MQRTVLTLLALLGMSCARAAQEKKPSLTTGRPDDRPSLTGKSSYLLASSRKMRSVRRLYIAPMENKLDFKLTEAFVRWGRFEIVGSEKEADAVVKGTCFAARRLKMVKSDIYIRARRTREPLWQDNLRLPYNPPTVEKVVGEMATSMVAHLRASMQNSKR
ncbi:MAG: hypothetical protein V3R60_01765 [Acidobacteriota bacterium]